MRSAPRASGPETSLENLKTNSLLPPAGLPLRTLPVPCWGRTGPKWNWSDRCSGRPPQSSFSGCSLVGFSIWLPISSPGWYIIGIIMYFVVLSGSVVGCTTLSVAPMLAHSVMVCRVCSSILCLKVGTLFRRSTQPSNFNSLLCFQSWFA